MNNTNFIIIYCDDLGYGDLGCYGSADIYTPHIDALAHDGVRFTNWYSNSPVCSPSRASLLTGRYPGNAGVTKIVGGKRGTEGLPKDQTTLAEVFKSNGYETALFGKWHLGGGGDFHPNEHGFNEFFGFMAGCVDYYSHIFYWAPKVTNPVHDLWHNREEVWMNGEYLTEVITKKSVEFIENNSDQPFFMKVAYNAPHYPMHAPKKYMDRYGHLPWDRQVMAAMITAVDDGVGEIVNTLKRSGQYENTVIFFSSDNGPSTEARNWLDGTEDFYYGGTAGVFRGHKGSLFEGGIREPAILCCPSLISSNQVCDEIGIMMDIFPTFLEIGNVELPKDLKLDGMSILPMITENVDSPHTQIFWEMNDQLAVRKQNWKLVINGKLDFSRSQPERIHLSNLKADPGERENLKVQYPEIVKELEEAARDWYENLVLNNDRNV